MSVHLVSVICSATNVYLAFYFLPDYLKHLPKDSDEFKDTESMHPK